MIALVQAAPVGELGSSLGACLRPLGRRPLGYGPTSACRAEAQRAKAERPQTSECCSNQRATGSSGSRRAKPAAEQSHELGLTLLKNAIRQRSFQPSKRALTAFGGRFAHTKACFNRYRFDQSRQGTRFALFGLDPLAQTRAKFCVFRPSVGCCQGWRSHRKAGPRSGILYSAR
jgi:hypothetical protein